MYLCYTDESGTFSIPGNTSHFVLAAIAIPIWRWHYCESEINRIKSKYKLLHAEIHTGWILRPYNEQNKIQNFSELSFEERRSKSNSFRKKELIRLQKSNNIKLYRQFKKNYRHTENYTHLTFNERLAFIQEVASNVGSWGFARLFGECVDKIYFDPEKTTTSIDEQAFEQVVSRFEQYLKNTDSCETNLKNYGLIIHDNNETIAKRHTELMKKFYLKGTLWTKIENIIETPLFVNSQLTGLVQIADLCAYSIRRYLENGEENLFNEIFKRADRKNNVVVGLRHFTENCQCKICEGHRTPDQLNLFENPNKLD